MNPESLLHPLLLPTQKLTLGCPILDRFLRGGLPCNSVTELVSESGCGKTQLSLQLLLSAQLSFSLAASSLYIHSEFPFPLRRLRQLSLSFPTLHNPLDQIFIRPVHSADQLFDLLLQLDVSLSNQIKTQLPIKLVVIDSIAALFRSEFDNTPSDLKRRSSLFFKISSKLKSLANRFGLVVVVTNQVVDFVGPDDGLNGLRVGNLGCLYSSGRRVCPALGLSWANCVNSRLFLSRDEEVLNEEKSLVDVSDDEYVQRRTRRQIRVIFAPHLPESSCEYVIAREGVFGIER
ncbi:hypothetical protein RHSIM_Rhsim03G0264200 [Rhododendron simsii]|uniref:RecA family profile 1 domain-containing protein n=1 Tax=Rhododendron simsii TaxID=118357 RepID=A0A834H6N1_RHOSS|nr:hypothetical protein RHSIM_Rhsim03G0264200 [Rhododendron simsii]